MVLFLLTQDVVVVVEGKGHEKSTLIMLVRLWQLSQWISSSMEFDSVTDSTAAPFLPMNHGDLPHPSPPHPPTFHVATGGGAGVDRGPFPQYALAANQIR